MTKPGEPQPIVALLDAADEFEELLRRADALCGDMRERETVLEMTERRLARMGM